MQTRTELRYLYRLKTQFGGLYPTLGTYSGAKPIALLGFLSTLKEPFNAYGTSEAVAVRALAYFLTKQAKDVYQAQVKPGTLDSSNALEETWPYLNNALIRRFLADDDILQSAYDSVVRATQDASEDEIKYSQRVKDAARECCHVLQPIRLLNSYMRVLHEATRERIQEQVRRLPLRERAYLVTVRQMVAAKGRAQGTLLRPHSSRSAAVRTSGARPSTRTPAFFTEPQVDLAPVQYPSPPTTSTTSTSF